MPRSVAPIISRPSGVAAARVRDRQALAAAAILARRHAELAVGLLVDAAAGAEAGLVDRIGDRRILAQLLLQRAQARGRLIFLRRAADDRLEIALQVERAVAGALRELRQAERLLRIRLDLARQLVDDCVDRAGAASTASLRRDGSACTRDSLARAPAAVVAKNTHVLAQRAARRAGRAAVDAGGLHARRRTRPCRTCRG